MRARSSRMKDNNSNELNDEQPSCKNSKPLIPKTEVNGPKDDKKDSKSNMPDDEIIRHTTDIDKKEDKEIQTDTIEKPCIYKESSTNTDEEGLDSWTRAVGLETLYQVVVREHQDLQRAHQALLAKLKAEQRARLDLEAPIKTREENPINLALAAQIEELTARQEELISENLDLREQNDLLEFRLLEMDSAPASLHFKTAPASPSRSPESRGGDREVDDVSDSGVLSLPTSEDISEADFHDLAMEPSSRDIKFKLAQLCLSIENVTDKVSIQQGLSLLRHYEVRLETALNTLSQDSLSVRSLTSPDSVISSETSKSQSRIIATVLPFTDLSQSCGKQKDDVPLKKLFKDADCLQESGIFEESPEYCSRCTQTDCSSAKLETTGDLSLEIRKLKQIQERIEEQGSNKRLLRANVNEGNGLSAESKELAFYRERVEMLENKLAIYESSGDEQMKKMNLRLDREILLSAEIKHLKERCRMLEELNRKLEEEKCEYEEAENDTRLRCQKLEVKLSALGEKKSDLQVQLQQNARTMSNLRSCLAEEERKRIEARQHASRMENLVQHYEQRNFELEEKEIESRCRAQMLEKTIPALKVYNTWKVANAICQSAGRNSSSHKNNSSSKMIMSPSEVDVGYHGGDDRSKSYQNHKRRCVRNSLVPSYETEIGDQCMNHHELSTIDESDCIDQDDDYEDYLHDRIKQLELAIKCKEELQQQSLSPDQKNSLILKIQELKKTNCDLECRLKDLELKEGYYKQTLQQADEMWANMEGGYKQQLRELENKLDDKQNEIYEFEAMVRKLSCEKEMRQQLQERTCSLESEMKDYRFKIAEKECERKLLEKERLRLTEELEHTNEEFNYLKHVIEPSLRQQLEEHKKMAKELKREIESLEKDREQEIEDRLAEVSGLKRKMNKLGKELLENECTIGELREEVQTLEMAVIELREKLEDVHDKHEREVMKMTMEIDDKSREIQFLKEKSTCEMKLPKSARQELEEAERQMQSCNSKDPSTSTACDQKPPKRHRKHKVISPHSTLRKLNEKIRAGLLKDDKKVLKNCDSQLGGEHLTDNISKTVSISRIPTDSLLAEIRDSTSDRSAIDLRKLPQDVEVHASKCVNVESGCNISASEHCTSFSSAIESKEDKELHVDAQSTESTPNSNTQLEKQISEKMFKHNQTDSSYTTESDEPFITPPQTPERKKRSDSHGRNSHKDHYSHKKHSKSSSSSMDSTQILICDNCLLKKKYILACISCGREIGEEGEGFSAYRTSTSSSDLEAIVSSQHMHGVKNHNNESEVPNENHGNASVKSGSDAAGLDHKLGDRNGKTDRNGVANQDLEGKDRKDDKKSYENGKTDSSNEEGTDSDGKDKDGDQTKDKNEKTDKKDEKDEDSDSKGKDGDNEDNSDDSDGDSNDDDKGDSSSKDPNNKRDSNSKDKDQGDDNGRDGNSRNNSSQGSNGEGGNDSTGGKDLNSDNQSDSNSNQAGKSIDGDNNKDNRANSDDGKAKENSVSGRDQEHSEEAEGSSKLIEMDLETFYVFMNPTMMSNHFFKIPVPDAIPIYKPRYYDSTLARTTDLFDGGPALWNSFSFSPYSSFKDQLAKRYIDGNDLKSFSIGKRYMKNETTSITNLSISDDKKPMANKKAEDVVYHSSSHTMKKDFPSTTKFNNQRNQLFCYDQNRSQFSSVPSELPSQYFHNSNKLFSRECAIPNKPGTKVTSEKLIELLINEDFRTQNQKSNTTLLANKGVEKNCLPERKQSLLKNNDCSFKDSLLSLLAFDTNVLKTESQKSDFKMLERRNSDDKKCQKTSKLERTLFQSSSRQARSSNDSIRKSKIHDNDNEMNDCYVKRMGIHDFELNVKEVIPKSNMGSDKMKAQSCEYELRSIEERCNELKHVDLVDHGRAKMDQKKESHESVTNLELTKNKAGKVSPLPSSNSLLMFLTNLIDGIYLKLFNEILIRIFENNSISLESHGVILKLYKNSLCSMLNGRIDRQQLFKNINEIENAFSEILKCFVSSKSVEIVENLVSRVLLQLRKPYRNECDLYVQNMNPITFVANYMESAEIIVVGLVARQITRLLKSVSIGKTNKILDSFLNQLNLLKPILGISNAQIDECDAVVEKIQELVLFFLEGICDPSNMRDALELVDIHLAIIDNIKSVKSKKEERNCLIQYLLENMSSVNISSHLNDVKNSESEIYLEKIQFQNTKRDVISSNLHKENESLCLKKVFNSMIVFRKLRKALGLTLKHVTDAITANKVKRFVSYYKDVCETLLCEHSTTNPDLKPIVIELEGEVKFILQFIDRQFLDIVQNIDCESSRACLLVDLEYMFDDHFRILNCLVSEMSVADDNRQDETSTCFRSEKEFDSTAAQNNTRVKSPLSEKKKEMCLNLVEKKTSLRSKSKVNHEGNAKNHESELPASTKHKVLNRPGRTKSKLIQGSTQVNKNDLIIIGKSIAHEQPQCFSKGSNNNNVSPSELYSKESNNDEKSNNNGSKNPNSNTFLDGNRKSDKLGTGTSKFDGENTSQVNLSPSFDLFCFIPKALTAAQTCDVSSNRKLPFGFKECNFIDDPNLELAKKVLNRSLERLVRSYDRADLKSYLQCLLLEIDHFLEPEHRTKTHYIENSVHLDQSQFLPRTVSDIKKFLTQCALKANKDHEIEHLKSEISQYISLYCKSEIRKCCRNEQTDSVVNLSALPSISVDGIRVSYNIIENRDLRENSDELLKQVPSKILNISDQSDVPPPPTSFNLPGTNFNKTSCLDSTSFHLDRIGREDDVTNIQSALNYSYSENDNDKPVQNICVGIKDYFNHCKSTMAQNTYKSFSSQYLENILSSLKTSENNNDKTEENIEVNIRDYFNHCKSTMTQDNYESFSSQYFENILESLNTHSTYMKSLEPINVPREYRNQQVYAVVEDMDGPQQENIPKEETVVAEVVDGHTASEQRESIASQILLSVVDDVTMEDQVIKSNTHVKLRDNWEDLCSLECHWPVIMKYRTGNYHYSFDQIGECDVECSEPIRMKYPLASESKEKEKLGVVFEEEESKLGGLQSLLYECLKKIKYDERLGNMKALLKSLIEHGHPPRSDDDSLIVTADEAARAIIKSDEEPQEKTCCDVCPIYCPCCIYNKNNPSSEFFVKNLQNDLKSKLDSLSGENENASSVADSRNADVDADNNQSLKDSSQEEIVQKFIMKSANDLYKDHHLPNNDFPDHEKEDLEQSESQTNNYSDPSGSKTKQPQEIAEESDLDQLEKNLNSSLNEIHEDPHTDNNKSKDSSNYIGLKQDDFQTNIDNNLTDHKHSNDINNEPIQEENTFESPKTSIPSTDETEITIVKTGSLENTHVLNKQEEIQNLDEHAVTTDDELSTGNIGETLVKNGEIEKDDSDKNIGDENDSKKKKCKKVGKKETDEKSGKPFDQTVSKNGTNLIGDSQNIAKDVKGEIRDTNGGLETSDINDNSKTEEYSLSEGVSKESDTSRNKPIDKINSGGGEPACRHERNCPHRRMNNLPDLDEPCDNDGNFEPPSVISLLSSLNILKTKIIVKDQIIQCLADQLIQMAQEGCLWKNDMFECISSQPSKRYVDFDSAMVADYLAGYVYEKPNKQPCVYIDLPDHPLKLSVEDFISFDAVKISWQPPPGCVRSGFDVYVNDELVERIRDPDVLATIVSNLDTRFVNLITVVMLDLDCIHCLMDTICISAVNSKKQNKISNYYQSLVTDDENSTSSSSEEVPNVNRKVERESLKFRVLKRKKKKL